MKAFSVLAKCSICVLLAAFLCTEAVPLAQETGQSAAQPNKTGSSSTLYEYITPEVMSTVVGAALGQQDCLRYSACQAGNYVAGVTGKEIVLMALDRWVPSSWQDTLRAFKEAATYKDDCKKQFPCDNPDQQE